MTNSTNNAQNSNCCFSHTLWTWLLVILLAIYLLWHWQHGHGPAFATSCCAGTSISTPAALPEPAAAFSFTASSTDGFNATGDVSRIAWATKSADLSAWLKSGADWKITGNASNVTLTGSVDSEEIKQIKGAEAQAFFGSSVIVDNQLQVNTVEATVPVAITAPPNAKLYFDTGKSSLPADASQTLTATIEWLKVNSNTKAIISGYSDPRGNLASNEELSKNRAKAVREMLKIAGIDEARIEMRKPETVESNGDLSAARRVEVSVE
ncbi:MAG: OmpA family protein [Methylotenera sp.]|nr:OmpA family protein [Methylotenera sp.]